MSVEQCAGRRSSSRCLFFVDNDETYGSHVVQKYLGQLRSVQCAVDLGAGTGRDPGFVKDKFPDASRHAVECMPANVAVLEDQGIKTYLANIEADLFPFS